METGLPDDSLITLGIMVSRVEALVVASMLEAGGVQVCVGGAAHASVAVNSLALGGHRLWVPASQYRFASELVHEVLASQPWQFSEGARRAVLKAAGWLAAIYAAGTLAVWAVGAGPLAGVLFAPLGVISMPVNPQGRGDFFLAANGDYPAA